MAIKIEELMVGSWVMVKGEKARAITIASVGCSMFMDSRGNEICAHIEEVEPIPITEAILQRNGFHYEGCILRKKLKQRRWTHTSVIRMDFYTNGRQQQLSLHDLTSGEWCCLKRVEGRQMGVHELQQLVGLLEGGDVVI